ncbi:hypothetical protein N7478_003003 [Penicillium angulare]|uniref:uncharacterized protein n=1 Tax=Penicillium angulare TaxID=116970 RepID=UPI0025422C34|nr:uncharacterized protein N7478_003003 [Penicillium angulare]KAJ5287317.1 hypothetical protein N7478_003003 [Penicillium angulare]
MESGQGQVNIQRAKKRKQELLGSLSTHDYLTPLKQSRQKRHGGTAEWLFEIQEFDHWITGIGCPVIYCSGKIGSGKTVLAASLIDRILIEKHDPEIFVSFFVRFDDHESLKTRSLKRLNIIIDGLDECQKREREDLLNALFSLVSVESDTNIRVFFSGRESVSREVERIFPRLKSVSMNYRGAQSDISTYIEGAVKGKLQSEELVVGNKDLIEEIKEALRNGADGMFLWVAFQIDELCSQCRDDDIRQSICNLPKDLPETFNRALRRIFSRSNTDIAFRSFCWVIAAKRPLTLEELKEAIFIEVGQESFKPEQLPCNIYQLNSLFRQFLIEGSFEASLHDLKFNIEDIDHYAGEICVTYLNFNDFKTKIIQKPKSPPRLGIEPIEIARKALDNEQRLYDYLQRIAGLKADSEENLASIDVAGTLANLQRNYAMSATRKIQLKHHYLAYSSVNVIHHTSQFQKSIYKTWDPWKNMLIHGHEHVSYPWGDRLFKPDDLIMISASIIPQIQQASAMEGDHTLLDISLHGATKQDIDQLLHPAIQFNHPSVVERLLAAGADLNASGDKWTALNLAAKCGYPDVLDILLVAGAIPNGQGADIERSVRVPLQAAAWKGHLYAVDRLLTAGADVNGSSGGETALLLAADSGHIDVVQRLLDAGADVSIRSAVTHRTEIQHAVEKGYLDTVKRILAAGADVNTSLQVQVQV